MAAATSGAACVIGVALLCCLLLLRALNTRKPLSSEHEIRLQPLRLSRVLTFLLLAVLQLTVVGYRIAHRHASPSSAVQKEELAMLCTWIFHTVRCRAGHMKLWTDLQRKVASTLQCSFDGAVCHNDVNML